MVVDGGQQIAIAVLCSGKEEPGRLKQDGGGHQFVVGGLTVAKLMVGDHGIGFVGGNPGKTFQQRVNLHPLHRDVETGQQVFQVLALHAALHRRDALVPQVE